MGPTWVCRSQMGPMLAPWTLLSGIRFILYSPSMLGAQPISMTRHGNTFWWWQVELWRWRDAEHTAKLQVILDVMIFMWYHSNEYSQTLKNITGYNVSVWYFSYIINQPRPHIPIHTLPTPFYPELFLFPDILTSCMEGEILPPVFNHTVNTRQSASHNNWDLIQLNPVTTWQCRADSRFAPSQWEMVLLCNAVSHWLGASLESSLSVFSKYSHINGLVQERSNSSASTMELCLSCTKWPSLSPCTIINPILLPYLH